MNETIKNEVLKWCERQCLSENRKQRYIFVFKELSQLRINLKCMRIKDMDKYFFYLKNSKYKDWTKLTKWKIFKKICRFIGSIDFTQYHFRQPHEEPEILTKEEICSMVEAATNFRDRLIILLLYESGIRLGELLSLHKENIIFDINGAVLYVNGKTGSRPVRIINASDTLKAYMKLTFSNKLFELTGRDIEIMIHNVAKKIGIKRRIYPHLFRHTRATHLAKQLTEPEMKLYFGWARNSNMPSTYVHLSARDVEQKIINIGKNNTFLEDVVWARKQYD